MGRIVAPRQNSVAGCLSPQLLGRDDTDFYQSGLLTCQNAIVLPYGGVTGRTGTTFVSEVKDSRLPVRFLTFQYSTEEAYVIEAGDLYFRFYAKSGVLLDGLGDPVELVTPYTAADVWDLQTAQSADVMYIVHPDYAPRKMTRTSVTSFSLDLFTFSRGRAPLAPLNTDPDNYPTTISGTWPNMTVTMTKDTFVNPDDVGRYFYVRNVKAKNAYYMQITSITSTKIAVMTGLDRYNDSGTNPQGSNGDRWGMSVFSALKGCASVTFHEGRLWYGGFKDYPSMVWGSVSDDFDNFEIESPDPTADTSQNDDKAINRQTLSSGGQVNTVRWMASAADHLVVGCSGSEFLIQANGDGILTPTSAAVKRQTNRGSAPVLPAIIDNNVVFAERSGLRLRAFVYDIYQSAYLSRDTSLRAAHLMGRGGGIRTLVYQQNPYSILWVHHLDGSLSGWTIERDQNVSAAHSHTPGGVYGGGAAQVESIAVIPAEFTYTDLDVPTGITGAVSFSNPGAETGDMTGWTADAGWTSVASAGATVPEDGTRFFANSSASTQTFYRSLNLTAWSPNTDMIDTGLTTITMDWWMTRYGSGGYINVTIDAVTADNLTVLERIYDLSQQSPRDYGGIYSWAALTQDTWEAVSTGAITLPPLTRRLRITFTANPDGCPTVDATQAVDNITLSVDQFAPLAVGARATAEDQLWMIVKRQINGRVVRYVELLTRSFDPRLQSFATDKQKIDPLDDAWFVDSGLELRSPIYVAYVQASSPAQVFTNYAHGLGDGDIVRFRDVKGDAYSVMDQVRCRVTVLSTTSFTVTNAATGANIDMTGVPWVWDNLTACYKEVTKVSGLTHLEGQTVQVFADGAVQTPKVVRAGAVTLDKAASLVLVGLPYTSQVETMPFFGAGQRGTDQMWPKNFGAVGLRMYCTLGGQVGKGSSPSRWETLQFRSGGDTMGRSPPMKTGDVRAQIEGSWRDSLPTISYRQTDPLPFTLLSVYADFESAED